MIALSYSILEIRLKHVAADVFVGVKILYVENVLQMLNFLI